MNDAGNAPQKRILLVQSAGDYLAAYRERERSGGEIYYGHGYILDELERMHRAFGEVAMLCCRSPERYVERLPNGVTVMGAQAHPRWGARTVKRMMDAWNPTHLVVLGPMTGLLRWGVRRRKRIFCQFADSFEIPTLRRLLRYADLPRLMNNPRVEWASNHGLNAARSLERFGVSGSKILPWDFPHRRRPDQLPPKLVAPAGVPVLLYVGTIQAAKGVGDAIRAVAALKRSGTPVELRIIGRGREQEFRELAVAQGVQESVAFLGTMPNGAVLEQMRAATAILVPSRHAYPEGLPLTIYECLCSRTPLIASDHPMFAGHLADRSTALVFPAGDVAALAGCVSTLLAEPALYRSLSESAQAAWDHMQIPTKWGTLLYRWVEDRAEDREWLSTQCIGAH